MGSKYNVSKRVLADFLSHSVINSNKSIIFSYDTQSQTFSLALQLLEVSSGLFTVVYFESTFSKYLKTQAIRLYPVIAIYVVDLLVNFNITIPLF